VYFTWYYVGSTNTLTELYQLQRAPFSTIVQYSNLSRNWSSLVSIKDKISFIFNQKEQYQRCRQTATVNLSLESWTYICPWLSPTVILQFIFPRNKL